MEILKQPATGTELGKAVEHLAAAPVWDRVDPADLEAMTRTARRLVDGYVVETGSVPLTDELRVFLRRDKSPWGLCVIEDVPGDEPRRSLLLISELFGDTVKFDGEGDYLIEVKEDPSRAGQPGRPGFNNSKEFFPHTDLSYVDEPPIFFCLHSVANDLAQGGLSEFVDITELKDMLKVESLQSLRAPDFLFPAPAHFQGGVAVKKAILSRGAGGTEQIRFRRDNLRCANRPAIDAVVDLCRTIQDNLTEVFLEPRALAVINNRRVLHGRTAFLGGAASPVPRHINRLYFTPNPDHEPMDGAFCD